jgi:hypothetical protein
MPVSILSRYLVSARQGHLEQAFHIFAYLKTHLRSTMVFDDTVPNYGSKQFVKCDWSEFYPDAAEAIPTNKPQPRGKEVCMSCFVDLDHAGCRETRRSHSGIIIFVNCAPIMWFSKRQNAVEASTYGSELLAMRIAIEMIKGLRYKLRMMGVPIPDECAVFCDNSAVVTNSRPESTLKKKHAAINFHRCGHNQGCKRGYAIKLGRYNGKIVARTQNEGALREAPMVIAARGRRHGDAYGYCPYSRSRPG